MGEVSSGNVVANLIWRLLERCGAQGVTFIVTIVLARLIAPEVYGIIAIVMVIINLLQVFVDSGLGNSLIQKKEADSLDFSSVFYFNMAVCGFLYFVLFITAPLISKFYGMPDLEAVIRVLGLTLIVSGVKNIQQAYVSKNLLFKKFFFATIVGTICAAFVGIYMAYKGYGVWALAAQSLLNNIIDTLILWITVKWRPTLSFSIKRLRVLFSFGWKLLFTSLLETLYTDLTQLIIGKQYSSAQLAYYNKGKQFPNYIVTSINSSIKSVMFPVFAEVQDNIVELKNMTRKSIRVSNFVISPLIIGLFAVAETFVVVLLTEKWLPCVPFLRLFSICFLFQPIQTTNKSVIKALGEGAILLKVQALVRIVGIIAIIITTKFGVMPMTIAVVGNSIFEQFLLAMENKKLINYGYFEQLQDMLPAILMSAIMGAIVYALHFLPINSLILLLLQIIVGGVVYLLCAVLSKNKTLKYLITLLRMRSKKK